MSIEVRFWGVRGSVASPGPATVAVGGNTSAIEVVLRRAGDDQRILLDAGTGLRALGAALVSRGEAVDATVLLSHLHWDHVQGIPFFAPIYAKQTKLRFVAGACGMPLREALHAQMRRPHFPVDLADLPADLDYEEVRDRARFGIGGATITVAKANHPDGVYAYRIEHGGHAIVYATDTEHYACVDPRLVALAKDADLLIYDAQYLPEEYDGTTGFSRVGWGHSTWSAAVTLARAAGVGRLALFHHDPTRDDAGVAAIEARARAAFGDDERVFAAREGTSCVLGAVGVLGGC
jgi:phosphoribosyl 1,2-cyclic phosphodiesterase